MPTRNSRKVYASDSYYHAYTRGVNKQNICLDDQDHQVLLSYLQRYLSISPPKKSNRQPVQSFSGELDLLSYCLMSNHIHLLFYQHSDERALASLLQRILTSYSMYFNKKYDRVGPVFQSRYLATRIDNDPYLHHISRYIHRNPKLWREYKFSSLRYYTNEAHADWVKPAAILALFSNDPKVYLEFVASMDEDDKEVIAELMAHE